MTRRWIAIAALMVAGCGSGAPIKPDPATPAPQITCPADVRVSSVSGISQTVDFPAPTVTGGSAPVATTCSQPAGTSFPLGTTAVTCAATDAAARQASCSFNVTLTGFAIPVTKFEAVGDSLTAGENGAGVGPRFVDLPNSYPTKLQALFDASFPGQGIVVVNQGHSGDKIEKIVELLPNNLLRDRPQVVLILGGYNNLTDPCGPGQTNTAACRDATTQQVPIGVRDCIRKAKESAVGIKFIFVSTLTPPGTGPKRIDRDAIVEANRRIVQMVAAERATLVDSYAAFAGRESEYVSVDGLHLNPAGYQALAEAFFAAIKATVPLTPLFSKGTPQ